MIRAAMRLLWVIREKVRHVICQWMSTASNRMSGT